MKFVSKGTNVQGNSGSYVCVFLDPNVMVIGTFVCFNGLHVHLCMCAVVVCVCVCVCV